MTKLYVGNLPYSFNDQALRDLFAGYGDVTSSTIIVDKISGRSKGFGFVELADDNEAQRSIAELNGKSIENRNVLVSVARPMEDRPRRAFNGGGHGGNDRGGFGRR